LRLEASIGEHLDGCNVVATAGSSSTDWLLALFLHGTVRAYVRCCCGLLFSFSCMLVSQVCLPCLVSAAACIRACYTATAPN
jgi:hypothetical protein